MKPFDLQEALNGAPVRLRNGCKAFIFKNIQNTPIVDFDVDYPLIGMLHNHTTVHVWSLSGKIALGNDCAPGDIVGMWEEPKLTSEQALEKAYQEGLRVRLDDGFEYPVIGKARGGSYLLGNERNTYIMWCEDFGKPEICREDTAESSPKSDTITVTLPKPFKPKQGETYYSITPDGEGVDTMHANRLDHSSILNGNCFRTFEDAQAWLDAMKNALDD